MNKEEIQLLKTMLQYVEGNYAYNALYRSPAQQLRYQAELLEKKEVDILEFKRLIVKLEDQILSNTKDKLNIKLN